MQVLPVNGRVSSVGIVAARSLRAPHTPETVMGSLPAGWCLTKDTCSTGICEPRTGEFCRQDVKATGEIFNQFERGDGAAQR
jgi:hypothetical protein